MYLGVQGLMPRDLNTIDDATMSRVREHGFTGVACRYFDPMSATEREVKRLRDAMDALTSVDDIALLDWSRLIDVNLTGPFLTAKHTVQALRRSGGGVIVMIASGAGVRGPSSSVPYGASKGGVNGLAMTLERMLAPDEIRVNVICPGNISTPLKLGIIEQQVEKVGEEANREGQITGLGTPSGVAKLLAFMLSDDAEYPRIAVFTR